MYMNVVQHYNCQPQDNFSTLNITLSIFIDKIVSAIDKGEVVIGIF